MSEQRCENCRFWHSNDNKHDGHCRRRAPVSTRGDNYLHDISKALKLLLWWSISEWKGDADEQLRTFNLEVEDTFFSTVWPETEAQDWCGDWEAVTQHAEAAA